MTDSDRTLALADALHSAAIHLIRFSRAHDPATHLTPARLSLLSVLVFRGPSTIGELAEVEQVSSPAISRMVGALEEDELVVRARSEDDRRVVYVRATAAGRRLMKVARRRRLEVLADHLSSLSAKDQRLLERATAALERAGWGTSD